MTTDAPEGATVLRPLVKAHPRTGRKFFHAGRHAFGIPGLSLEESQELLESLTAIACQPPRVYEHDWAEGDLVLWDQQRIMHRARPYHPSEARALRGTGVLGDPATEAAITGTAEADRRGDALMAEIERLKGREGFAKGTLPPAAL